MPVDDRISSNVSSKVSMPGSAGLFGVPGKGTFWGLNSLAYRAAADRFVVVASAATATVAATIRTIAAVITSVVRRRWPIVGRCFTHSPRVLRSAPNDKAQPSFRHGSNIVQRRTRNYSGHSGGKVILK